MTAVTRASSTASVGALLGALGALPGALGVRAARGFEAGRGFAPEAGNHARNASAAFGFTGERVLRSGRGSPVRAKYRPASYSSRSSFVFFFPSPAGSSP